MTLDTECTGSFVLGSYCYDSSFFGSLGSCCDNVGMCRLTSQDQCVAPSTWLGTNSCSPNPCPPGACCSWDGSCQVKTHDSCYSSEAYWDGSASCSPSPCPADLGACCSKAYDTDGICVITTQAQCSGINSSAFVAGHVCSLDTCLPVPVRTTTWGRIKNSYR